MAHKSPAAVQVGSWFQRTWAWLFPFIYARVKHREEAEDLTQEAVARLVQRGDPTPSRSLVVTVALNLIRDRWRRREREKARVPLEEAPQSTSAHDDALLVQELMARLTAEYRTVLELRLRADLSREETARQMGRSEGAVRGLQYRALQSPRELMKEEGER